MFDWLLRLLNWLWCLWSQLAANQFFQAFLPNFAATVLGLLIGLPLALWTNRRVAAYGEKLKQQNEEKVLANALSILGDALFWNAEHMEILLNDLKQGRAAFDPLIDYATWDVVKADVASCLHDSKLKQGIAFHFSRMARLSEISKLYLNYCVGVESTLTTAEAMRNNLLSYFLSPVQLTALIEEARRLEKQTRELSQGLNQKHNSSSLGTVVRRRKLV